MFTFLGIRVMSKKLYRDLQIILEKKSKELQDTNDKEDFKQLESILDVAVSITGHSYVI